MTLIAATTDKTTVRMAADSGETAGMLVSLACEPKVWLAGELLIGACGTVRACQLARYRLAIPPISGDLRAYFVTDFWDALAPLIPKDDYLSLLIGARGQLFQIHPGGAVTSDTTVGYAAVGCAAPVALGALYAGGSLQTAMEAGVRHCGDIRPPFTFLQTPASAP